VVDGEGEGSWKGKTFPERGGVMEKALLSTQGKLTGRGNTESKGFIIGGTTLEGELVGKKKVEKEGNRKKEFVRLGRGREDRGALQTPPGGRKGDLRKKDRRK